MCKTCKTKIAHDLAESTETMQIYVKPLSFFANTVIVGITFEVEALMENLPYLPIIDPFLKILDPGSDMDYPKIQSHVPYSISEIS